MIAVDNTEPPLTGNVFHDLATDFAPKKDVRWLSGPRSYLLQIVPRVGRMFSWQHGPLTSLLCSKGALMVDQ